MYSTLFDTIDHTILLRRLDDWFGVTGKALDWFKSYQSINHSNFYSPNIPGVAGLSGATARSVFKYKVVEAIP